MDDMDSQMFTVKYKNYFVVDGSKDSASLLRPNIEYGVQVSVTLSIIGSNQVVTGYAQQVVEVNDVPSVGNCYLSIPTDETYALTTLVTAVCDEWYDPDEPLSYQFEIDNGVFTYFCFIVIIFARYFGLQD